MEFPQSVPVGAWLGLWARELSSGVLSRISPLIHTRLLSRAVSHYLGGVVEI